LQALPYLSQVTVVASFFAGIACINYIRSFDLYEKEPFTTMLAVTCWGGAWSVGLSVIFYGTANILGLTDLKTAFGAFFVIGPVEEMAKLLAFLSCYWLMHKEMNEPVDGIIYMSCVALGFSIIENYFYVVRAANPTQVMVLRLAMSTPMHISFSAFMGLACYLLAKTRGAFLMLPLAYIYACLVHGLYDAVIFTGWALLFLLIVIKIAHTWTLTLLSYATARSPFRRSLKSFIAKYPSPAVERGIECLHCGNSEPKTTYRLGKASIQKCGECDHYVTTKSGLLKLFAFFAATFRGFPAEHYWRPAITGKKYSTLYRNNWLSEKKGIASFTLDQLSDAVDELNEETVKKMEDRWWFPRSAFVRAGRIKT